ncbi:MAG TPA: hypothetical protein VLE89_04330 [Chlamydiales bacterium]|nr:hypothetical protein [Chlamydiales bacterium]
MREFSRTASFSRNIFGSKQGIEKGEKPARAMNGKERWQFFAKPPPAIQEFFKLLSWFSFTLDAEVTTLPWDLCHGTTSSPTIATNFLEEVSPESMELGKHEDYNTEEEGIAFGIPILYGKGFHPSCFINGAPGKPWLISALIYSTHENFRPEYGMGTMFYKKDGTIAFKTPCRDLRVVICEGDILHSIEQSHLPPNMATWRVSYVFKLALNPKSETQSMKQLFSKAMSG